MNEIRRRYIEAGLIKPADVPGMIGWGVNRLLKAGFEAAAFHRHERELQFFNYTGRLAA